MLSKNKYGFHGLPLVRLVAVACSLLIASSVTASTVMDISVEEYASYKAWVDGKEDPRLANDNDQVKMRKIAKQEKLSVSSLKAIIKKVDSTINLLKPENQKAISTALNQTVLSKRVREVEINTASSYVVAYVKWECGDKRDIDTEAAYVAWATAQAGSTIKTLGLWCVDKRGVKQYSATIERESFSRVNKASVKRFGKSRYARLFQDIKRGPHT